MTDRAEKVQPEGKIEQPAARAETLHALKSGMVNPAPFLFGSFAAKGRLLVKLVSGNLLQRIARAALIFGALASPSLAQVGGPTGYGWCSICGTDVYLPGHTHASGGSSGGSYQGRGNLFRSFGEALGRTLRNRPGAGSSVSRGSGADEQAVRGAAARFAEQSKRIPKDRSASAQANAARAESASARTRGAPGSVFDTSGRSAAPSANNIDSERFGTLRERIAKENAERRAYLAKLRKQEKQTQTSAPQPQKGAAKSKPKLASETCKCGGLGCHCVWNSCGSHGAARCGCEGVDCSCRDVRCPKFVVTAGCSGFVVSKADGKKHCLRAGR